MNLLDSLLDAIVRLDGDALVMHVGEKPYVVTTSEATNQFRGPLAWGQVELSTRVLTTDAVSGMLGQILPLDQRSTLDEFGATEYDVAAVNHADERFTIVAARGGDDIWVEMRRHRKVVAPAIAVPEPEQEVARLEVAPAIPEPAAPPVPEPVAVAAPVAIEHSPVVEPIRISVVEAAPERAPIAVSAAPVHEEAAASVEDVDVVESQLEAEIEVPLTLDPSDRYEDDAVALPAISLSGLESDEDEEETVELDAAFTEPHGLELDLEHEIEAPFDLDADVEAGILAATQEWGDDVMTEGELGELLRATAAAVITGETLGIQADHVATENVAHLEESPAEEPVAASAPLEFEHELEIEHELDLEHEQEVVLPSAEIAPVPVPVARIEPEAPRAVEPVDVPHVAAIEEDARVSRETRELPALVEYQIERDRAVAAVAEPPAVVEPFVAVQVAAPEQIHAKDDADARVSSTEGVWPVSEDLTHDSSQAPTSDAATPVDIPIVQIAAASGASESDVEDVEEEVAPTRPAAVVLPLTRQAKVEGGGDARANVATNLQRLLRLAANRGAATVYVVANAAPLVRVDGEFSTLEGESAISAPIVERLLAEVSPAGKGSTPPSAEWLIDVPEIGRVRCLTFRDHRGPGIIFRMVPPRAIAADQLGLSAEIQALCSEADGLVLVTGGRDSGRSTLLASFVDLVNRGRSDYIVTVEPQIDFVHESKRSFISQREVRGEDAMVGAVRAASREQPDVLVIEDIRSHEVAALALDAAESGRLVFASVPGLSTSSALERLIELFPADRREKAQISLAGSLRGVVSQVLLRKLRGGRVAAREVLLNTPVVSGLIMEGKTFQLPAAIENGRRAGMVSIADSLSTLVREGVVHPSHAYRKAPSRDQLVAALRRDGIDAGIAERLG